MKEIGTVQECMYSFEAGQETISLSYILYMYFIILQLSICLQYAVTHVHLYTYPWYVKYQKYNKEMEHTFLSFN